MSASRGSGHNSRLIRATLDGVPIELSGESAGADVEFVGQAAESKVMINGDVVYEVTNDRRVRVTLNVHANSEGYRLLGEKFKAQYPRVPGALVFMQGMINNGNNGTKITGQCVFLARPGMSLTKGVTDRAWVIEFPDAEVEFGPNN